MAKRLSPTLINDSSRLFIQAPIELCCNNWEFVNCIGMGELSQDSQDDQHFYCPSSCKSGEFEIIATIPGNISEVAETDLTAYFPRNDSSIWRKLYKSKCFTNWQVHFGSCNLPSDFNNFEKALLFYDVRVKSHRLNAIAAIRSADRNVIQETISIEMRDWDEILNPQLEVIRNEVLDQGVLTNAFNFCDGCPCICEGTQVNFYPQLREVSEGCYELWLAYDTNGTFGALRISTCPNILETQILTSATVQTISGIFSFFMSRSYTTNYHTRAEIILRSLFSSGVTLYDIEDNCEEVLGVGTSGLRRFNYQNCTIEAVTANGLPTSIFYSIDSYEGEHLVGGADGNLYLEGNPWVKISTPTTQDILHAQYLDEETYLISTRDGHLYRYCNGIWDEIIICQFGTISAMEFYNKFVGIAVVNTDEETKVYRTLDGGMSWHQIGDTLSNMINLRHISFCENNPNDWVISGRESETALTVDERVDPDTPWNPDDTGIVVQPDVT